MLLVHLWRKFKQPSNRKEAHPGLETGVSLGTFATSRLPTRESGVFRMKGGSSASWMFGIIFWTNRSPKDLAGGEPTPLFGCSKLCTLPMHVLPLGRPTCRPCRAPPGSHVLVGGVPSPLKLGAEKLSAQVRKGSRPSAVQSSLGRF